MPAEYLNYNPYPFGAYPYSNGISFSFISNRDNCGILIFDLESGKRLFKLPFISAERKGSVYTKFVEDLDITKISYLFYEEDQIVPDPLARRFVEQKKFGSLRGNKDLKAVIDTSVFDWEEDACPSISYQDCIVYCMHVRGFTKHSSSNVSEKGTFQGLIDKISYLKEIGITTVELQPVYEFLEVPTANDYGKTMPYLVDEKDLEHLTPVKMNYWGYKQGFYYAPKAAYSASNNPVIEFKNLVKTMHQNGIEVILQMYFNHLMPQYEMINILRFWSEEYHVDGFHLMGDGVTSMTPFVEDPYLYGKKLWWYKFDKGNDSKELATYTDDYMYTMRKFLKGDDNMVDSVMFHMRHIPSDTGSIHFFSNYFGMTMMDMVSYERKHNEENGEENRDGNNYNCSWNCGTEGRTRKKKIQNLRINQLKNAYAMLLLGQATPLIFMGDEFGNSQNGNNNPYCQDNATTWLNWDEIERNKELFTFWKEMIAFRKAHPILRMEREPKCMDYAACGYPDLSYHGESAWKPQREMYSRTLGMMYCGKYAKISRTQTDDFLYIAMNMYWEDASFGLPKLPKGMYWKEVMSTVKNDNLQDGKESAQGEDESDLNVSLPPRSIAIFLGKEEINKAKGNKKRK